jgi:formylglycine-generating enzyme required for sulfatase activity
MDGKGEPILVHNADWSLVSSASPVRPSEYLILFLTGLGEVSPSVPAGQAGGDGGNNGPLNQLPAGTVTVTFGGKQAGILFAGLAPGFVGLYQINLQVPADLARGASSLVASTKDGASQAGVDVAAEGIVGPVDLGGGVKMEFISIPAGQFMMGCSPGEKCGDIFSGLGLRNDENPSHLIQITRNFEIGKYEVTQAQWQAVMGNNPSRALNANAPVTMVSWNDAQSLLTKLNARNDGFRYRLPTEAEWEYSARAGTTGPYYGYTKLGDVAWYYTVANQWQTHPVGQKLPNPWGLFDMLGNAAEWCQDWYDNTYYGFSRTIDPPGPSSRTYRVTRGGSTTDNPDGARVSSRGWVSPGESNDVVGFRVVRQ